MLSGGRRDELLKSQQLCSSIYFAFTGLQSRGKGEGAERSEEILKKLSQLHQGARVVKVFILLLMLLYVAAYCHEQSA